MVLFQRLGDLVLGLGFVFLADLDIISVSFSGWRGEVGRWAVHQATSAGHARAGECVRCSPLRLRSTCDCRCADRPWRPRRTFPGSCRRLPARDVDSDIAGQVIFEDFGFEPFPILVEVDAGSLAGPVVFHHDAGAGAVAELAPCRLTCTRSLVWTSMASSGQWLARRTIMCAMLLSAVRSDRLVVGEFPALPVFAAIVLRQDLAPRTNWAAWPTG